MNCSSKQENNSILFLERVYSTLELYKIQTTTVPLKSGEKEDTSVYSLTRLKFAYANFLLYVKLFPENKSESRNSILLL